MKIVNRFLGIVFGFSLFIVLLYAALIPNALNRSFYAEQFIANESYIEAHVSEEELNRVIDHVLRYLWNEEDDMQLTITHLDQSTSLAFNERELAHMVDVKNLFNAGRNLTLVSAISGFAIAIYFIVKRRQLSYKIMSTIRNTLFIILLSFALIGLYAVTDFYSAFTLFHQIFFTNDLWQLDYNDLLIIMLPESLFATIAYRTLVNFFIYLTLSLTSIRAIKKSLLQQRP